MTAAGLDATAVALEPPWVSAGDIECIEVTSEDRRYPNGQVMDSGTTGGWRASEPGRQIVRVRFLAPRRLRRIVLEFRTSGAERTQEYVLRYGRDGATSAGEIVRQQWNFSRRAPCETEDHRMDLDGVAWVELEIEPDIADAGARASLARLRIA